MSKSLKNFISIQDFLASYSADYSPSESPSDDFRLWCLGLSGSYRGPATFSEERLAEARTIRQQILRFLMEGQLWVQRQEVGIEQSSKLWEDVDHQLFSDCQTARKVGMEALNNDMEGSAFMKQCLQIVNVGNRYIYTSRKEEGYPIEPMITALSILRGMLSLVGFTDRTTKAGLESPELASGESSHVVGGEKAVIDLMIHFRSAVRHAALGDAKDGVATDRMKQILDFCDNVRDLDLPKIGVELLDGKAEGDNDGWRKCLPKSDMNDQSSKLHGGPQPSNQVNLEDVALEDLFRVGQHEGMFSEYTSDGIPTHNTDGSEVSNRALKKLLKKREAHKARRQEK
jgi:cysteinyl-tRNA synthetase